MLFVVFADFQIAECRLLFWLDAICDPNGGPAMIAWLQAFLGFPPPSGIPSIANRLLFCRLLRRFAAAAPGENLKRIINKKRTEVNKQMTNLKDF
jgi:hypothetical protein